LFAWGQAGLANVLFFYAISGTEMLDGGGMAIGRDIHTNRIPDLKDGVIQAVRLVIDMERYFLSSWIFDHIKVPFDPQNFSLNTLGGWFGEGILLYRKRHCKSHHSKA
jgi:hypothetical protein